MLAQLAGEATTLTEAEVQAHFSAEFFAVWREEWSPAALVAAFQQTIAERGTFSFVGFAYPPRARQALALVQSTTGERGAIEIGVTNRRPTRIEYFSLHGGPTDDRAQRAVVGLVRHRRAAAVPALHRPSQPDCGLRGRAHHRLVPAPEPAGSPQLAGLVLIDTVHPAYHRRRLAMLEPLVPPEVCQALRRDAMTPQHRLLDPERVDIWTGERQTRQALRRSPLLPMRLIVLARGHPEDPGAPFVEQDERSWRQLQRELAHLAPGGRLVVATNSGHDIQQQQPELVLNAICDVVRAVRAGDLVPHRRNGS